MSASHRLLDLARELRLAAAGRDGNPPGVAQVCLSALGGRFDRLASHLPADLAEEVREIACQLARRQSDLPPRDVLDFAVWLETFAPLADAGPRRVAGGSGAGGAA